MLALLLERPMHPYEMGGTMRERHKEDSIKLNYGSLYMVVEQLTRAGFVAARETVRDAARPERTIYEITTEGRGELLDWMRELISEPHKEYRDFEAGLALIAVLPPDEAAEWLRRRSAALAVQTAEAAAGMETALAQGLDPVFLVEEEYRIAVASAERSFVDRLVQRIERGGPEFGAPWRAFHQESGGTMSTGVTRVAVIGGGIAGPVAALALRRIGVDARVYEAYEHGAEQVGSFLTTASNGLAALQVLGAHEGVLAAGFPTPRFVISSSTGKRLADLRWTTTIAGRPDPITIRRSDLYRAVAAEVRGAGVPIEYGKRLDGVDELDGAVRARFTDGTSATADLLVGADGLRSRMRAIVDPAAPAPRYVGLLGCGGYASSVHLDAAPGAFHFVFGRRAFFGYTVPEPGQAWWFANLPRGEHVDGLRGERLRAVLLEAFAEDRIPATELIRATEHVVEPLPMHDLSPLPRWHRGRMVLVGDAAHVTSPSSGQGASLAIEDAVILAQCLRDLPDHVTAFERYQQLRWQRVKKVFDSAARVNSTKAAGPIGRRVRDALMPLALKLADPGKAQAAVQDYTIDWDRPLQHV